MDNIGEVTQETLEMIKKAQTAGLFVSTGIQGIDLGALTSQIPVNVPARNNTSAFPRVIAGEGSQTAVWRSLLNINSQQSDAAVGLDFAGSLTKFEEQDCFAPYKTLAKAGRVTLDAVAVARNYADALATAELQTLNQLFIDQDLHIINSQNWSLGKIGTGTKPTISTAATGGSIPKTVKEVSVVVAARSGANYFIGGSTEASEVATLKLGEATETNTVKASIPAVKCAVAYDWYVGLQGGELYYYTTTTTAAVVVTAVPGAAQALPKLPLLSAVLPPKTAVLLAARTPKDTSFSPNWYNGVLASNLGDYGATGPVTPGTGTASGVTFIDAGGAAITGEASGI